ncbi:MAG: prepilin-type N-terminal cleavage/methylation domain-containing protein [Oscillospiraceae bacterium]|nr:prepilin-type N-terminal cleavage/methylation domain-containing protein [Oscillospiraceae bacterium]
MKSKFKGFTLVECLVALAILGIGALVMAEIYANVNRINLDNHLVNTSLSQQMKYVEKYTDSETVKIVYGTTESGKKPAHKLSGTSNNNYITIKSNYQSSSYSSAITFNDTDTYSYAVNIYVLLSRDSDDLDSDDAGYSGESEDKYNLRYRYMQGYSS